MDSFPYLTEHERFGFPPPESANDVGIVCAGGNLSPGMLISAYSQGLFPWYSDNEPLLWWCPDPRFVLYPNEIHVSKSLARTIRRERYTNTMDTVFSQVITACKSAFRPGQRGTWITDDMNDAYIELHRLGYAHSVETWEDGALVGGLYGISLGRVFFGESMFSLSSDASKTALVELTGYIMSREFHIIDCQDYTPHLEVMGARNIGRSQFLEQLRLALGAETCKGSWENDYCEYRSSR